MNAFRKLSPWVLVAVIAVIACGSLHSSATAGDCHSGGYGYRPHGHVPSYCHYGTYPAGYADWYYPASCYYPAWQYPADYWSSSYPLVKPVRSSFPSTHWQTGYSR